MAADVDEVEGAAATGVEPEVIDTVILTHAHADHIGGAVDESGKPVFPKAQYVMWQDEWDFWTGEPDLSSITMHEEVKQLLARVAREKLAPLESQMDLLSREGEIVPGVHSLEAKGHTPGHMAVSVSSESEELLYISDTVLHPLHLTHPEWQTDYYDYDLDQADASKRRIFDYAAVSEALVLAFHFDPFPSLGYVTKSGDGWQWQDFAESLH